MTDWECRAETPAGACYAEGVSVKVDDVFIDKRYRRLKHSIEQISLICVPILSIADGAAPVVTGVIKCANKVKFSGTASGIPFSLEEMRTAEWYGKLVGEEAATFVAAEGATRALAFMGIKLDAEKEADSQSALKKMMAARISSQGKTTEEAAASAASAPQAPAMAWLARQIGSDEESPSSPGEQQMWT